MGHQRAHPVGYLITESTRCCEVGKTTWPGLFGHNQRWKYFLGSLSCLLIRGAFTETAYRPASAGADFLKPCIERSVIDEIIVYAWLLNQVGLSKWCLLKAR